MVLSMKVQVKPITARGERYIYDRCGVTKNSSKDWLQLVATGLIVFWLHAVSVVIGLGPVFLEICPT